MLANIASELRDVPGDSSTSDLDRTIDYAGRVAERARDLKYVAEDDADARRMADYYPDIAGRYRDYTRYLREMKSNQRRLDELPRKCEDTMRELAGRLRSFTDTHDPRGVEEVPRLARELGKVGKDALELAERTRYEQAAWYERVDDFSDSEGKWSDVRSNLHAAGRTILEGVQRQQEQLKRDDVCGNLAKEERNPLVEEAVRKLFEGKKGIELSYDAMDRQLVEIAAFLDRLDGDSSDSDLASAESKLGELERQLDQLDRIRGNDGEARRRVETWRNVARAAREAWKQLRTLKQAQFLADKAPEKCKEADARLQGLIRDHVERNKPEGARLIQAQARVLAESIKAGLARTDEQHGVMERALSDAQRFEPSEGRWRQVSERHRASAVAIWEYWKKARENAHGACDELAKGEAHRDVQAAVDKIKLGAASEIDRFKADVDVWVADAVSLFQLDCTQLDALWLALCGADEEPNEWPDRDAARATARQIGDQMRPRIDPMLARYDVLRKRADELMKDDGTRDRAEQILRRMDEQKAKFTRLQTGGALRGADHPMTQYAAEHGKQMHDAYASKYNCNVYDQPYEGAGGRPDCIVVGSACYVYEFKPDTPAALRQGGEQLDRYVPAVMRYYRERIERKAGDDGSAQGRITSLVERMCFKSGTVDFDDKVVPYPLCEKRFECTR